MAHDGITCFIKNTEQESAGGKDNQEKNEKGREKEAGKARSPKKRGEIFFLTTGGKVGRKRLRKMGRQEQQEGKRLLQRHGIQNLAIILFPSKMPFKNKCDSV